LGFPIVKRVHMTISRRIQVKQYLMIQRRTEVLDISLEPPYCSIARGAEHGERHPEGVLDGLPRCRGTAFGLVPQIARALHANLGVPADRPLPLPGERRR
ncbi:MAG: hypothetical protein ACRETH_08095, partial [Steroidobacteraceae bacterium]